MSDEGWASQLGRFQDGTFTPYDEKTGTGLERATPTEEECREPYAAPGRPAEHDLGVLYRADHETLEDGICRQARVHAKALGERLPVVLRSINNLVRVLDPITKERIVVLGSDDALDPEVYRQVGALRKNTMKQTAVCINHTVIPAARNLWGLLIPAWAQNDPKIVDSILAASIVYTPWERDRVHGELIELLNQVGQVWLQCERNKTAFVSSGLAADKVRIIPNAFSPDSILYQRARSRKRALRNHGSRAFYSIGKWEPRKDQHRLLGAFLRAFGPTDRATLYLKTHEYRPWAGYPSIEESVRHWLEDATVREKWRAEDFKKSVFFDVRTVSDIGIVEIHLANDIYVSASHAEGWDYPAFDAVSIGNRLVHVGFGGSEDYAPVGSVQIDWHMSPADPVYNWETGSQWADYTDETLERALLRARPAVPPEVVPVSRVAHCEEEAVGRLMAFHVRELAKQTGQPL